jgi:hypothetical protein
VESSEFANHHCKFKSLLSNAALACHIKFYQEKKIQSQQTLNPRQRIQLPRNPPNPLPVPHTHALATFLAIHEPWDLRVHILLRDPTGTPLVRPPFNLLSAVHLMAPGLRRR